jgi:hypothetical protein
MNLYVYRAAQLERDGTLRRICHEREFEAADYEAAIVTAEALHEVLHAAEHCNAIQVLDSFRNMLWTRHLNAASGQLATCG